MTKKIIDYRQMGKLHCDNPSCGHDLPEALPISEALIGYPCPKCGSDMLTRQDYNAAIQLMRIADFANKLLGPHFGKAKPDGTEPVYSLRIKDGAVDSIKRKS